MHAAIALKKPCRVFKCFESATLNDRMLTLLVGVQISLYSTRNVSVAILGRCGMLDPKFSSEALLQDDDLGWNEAPGFVQEGERVHHSEGEREYSTSGWWHKVKGGDTRRQHVAIPVRCNPRRSGLVSPHADRVAGVMGATPPCLHASSTFECCLVCALILLSASLAIERTAL